MYILSKLNTMQTRSNKYSLDTVFFNESMTTWIDEVHTHISNLYGMRKIKIKPMDYGYDSYAYVLHAVLSKITVIDVMSTMRSKPDTKKFIEGAHNAWVENYLFWKSIQNFELSDNPKKSINTIERNDRATTHFNNLNSIDLGLYNDIIEAVFDLLTKKIFEAGMQNLAIQ